MKHYMKLNPIPFNSIRTGKKTIELRLYDEKRRLVKIGDEIEFTNLSNTEEKISVSVVDLHKFDSFKALYENLPLNRCGYDENDIAMASYKDMLAYYSEEEQKNYGVVGIEIRLLKSR